MIANINEVISNINHTQRLFSNDWQPDDADWVRQFRSLRQNKTIKLPEHKISFTTLHITNWRTGFRFLYITFFQRKHILIQLSFLWGINIYGSRTSKYSCELMPAEIHEVRSKIKHTRRLRPKFWKPDDANWVWQFRNLRQNETSRLQFHNISFTTLHRTNSRTCFSFLSLAFVWV